LNKWGYMNNNENDLLELALDALKKNINLIIEVEKQYPINNISTIDLLIKIKLQKMDLYYGVEIKPAVNKADLGVLLRQKGNFPQQQLLVAKYVNPNMAEELRKNGIQFIDIAGNAYLNNFPLYVYIKGNKPDETLNKALRFTAFKPTGLKMIYALLCDAGLADKPYREMARTAGIALGTVGWVLRDLKEFGFLIDLGAKGKKLVHKKELLDRWCRDYAEKLRPKLALGKFKGPDNWWKGHDIKPGDAQWGGEVAATLLTNYLKPQQVIVYLDRNKWKDFIIQNRLARNTAGETELLERFWPTEKKQNMVHPMLVYADLLATGDQRNIETAEVIYEQHIAGYFGKD
jgi:hypothetical protein